MKKAVVLTHVAYEGPAALAPLLTAQGYALDIRALHQGAEVPTALAPGEILIVMGGPMGVGDVDEPAFPFLRSELELLRTCVQRELPVLGVCLGAQLLAHAAGAAVYPMRGAQRYEVGWSPLDFELASGGTVLDGLPPRATVLHLHGDTFDLPRGARRLASTPVCANQAFRLGPRQFGLQFHCEMRAEHVAAFLAAGGDFVVKANGPEGIAALERDTARYEPEVTRVAERLFGNMLTALGQ